MAILVIWIFKFDELNKHICFWVQYWFADHWIVAYLKYLNTFYLDNENEFIINEGIFNKTKQLFSWIESTSKH
jgi:uncharacterized membrane protein YdbT with pleckstrin-like domain